MSQTLLIVDDEPNLLRLLEYAFQVEGYNVRTAATGRQALVAASKTTPDLVILDWMLPDLSGLEILVRMRRHPRTAGVPVIMLSARSDVPDKIKALEAGADEYVVKPVENTELVARVKSLLRRTRQLRQQARRENETTSVFFMGAKGGVGGTTVALNTAVCLAERQRSTILVEFSSRPGGVAAHVNLEAPQGLNALADLDPAAITRQLISPHLIRYAPKLQILPCGHTPILPAVAAALLHQLRGLSEFLVVDFSAASHFYTKEVLGEADRVLLLLEREPTSGRAAAALLKKLSQLGFGSQMVELLLVNRSRLATSLSKTEIEQQIGCNVAGVLPMAADALFVAQQKGLPLVTFQPQNPASAALRQLAEYVEKPGKSAGVPAPAASAG